MDISNPLRHSYLRFIDTNSLIFLKFVELKLVVIRVNLCNSCLTFFKSECPANP